ILRARCSQRDQSDSCECLEHVFHTVWIVKMVKNNVEIYVHVEAGVWDHGITQTPAVLECV
ncbi:MAG: hypothetical protein IJN55_06005, partial [Alistipes sp.]|nr:hypothetical protein [Alistipes sp.]